MNWSTEGRRKDSLPIHDPTSIDNGEDLWRLTSRAENSTFTSIHVMCRHLGNIGRRIRQLGREIFVYVP
jgi:hypothetical protein